MKEEILYQETKEKILRDKEFQIFIEGAIRKGLEECAICPVPKDVRESMAHWSESIKTIGNGNFDHGVERIRKNHDFTSWLRETQTKVGGWVLKIFVTALTGVILASVAFGLFGKKLPFK